MKFSTTFFVRVITNAIELFLPTTITLILYKAVSMEQIMLGTLNDPEK